MNIDIDIDKDGKWARGYLKSIPSACDQLKRHEQLKEALRERTASLGSPLDTRKAGMPRKPTDGFDHSMDVVDKLIDLEADDGMQWARDRIREFDRAVDALRPQLTGKLASALDCCWMRYRYGLTAAQVGLVYGYVASYVRELTCVFVDYLDYIGPTRFFNPNTKED